MNSMQCFDPTGIPQEMWCKIFDYLPERSLEKMQFVSKFFNEKFKKLTEQRLKNLADKFNTMYNIVNNNSFKYYINYCDFFKKEYQISFDKEVFILEMKSKIDETLNQNQLDQKLDTYLVGICQLLMSAKQYGNSISKKKEMERILQPYREVMDNTLYYLLDAGAKIPNATRSFSKRFTFVRLNPIFVFLQLPCSKRTAALLQQKKCTLPSFYITDPVFVSSFRDNWTSCFTDSKDWLQVLENFPELYREDREEHIKNLKELISSEAVPSETGVIKKLSRRILGK